MIFSSVNKGGVPAYELIASGVKTVTRRRKPLKVGSVHEVYFDKNQVCKCGHLFSSHSLHGDRDCEDCITCVGFEPLRIHVTSCVTHKDWYRHNFLFALNRQEEAEREGFSSWQELINWFKKHDIDINEKYRIGLEVKD